MFGWEFPPHIAGGLGTACYGIAKGLTKNGVEVLFVMPKASGDEDQRIAHIVSADQVEVDPRYSTYFNSNQNIAFIEFNSKLIPYIGMHDYYTLIDQLESNVFEEVSSHRRHYSFAGGYGGNLMQEIDYYAAVAEQLAKTQEFDVIHAHDWHTYKAGIIAKKVSGKPLVVHIHATEFDRSCEGQRNDIVMNIEREGMMAADIVCAVSDLTRNIVINNYHIPANKVITLHNAIEPNKKEVIREKNVPEKVVTFLGRVTFQKGPEYFVETARKILEKDDHVRFVLVGDGDMMSGVIERVAELGISDKFHFTGFLRGEEINKMFGMSDVYVMPSVSEPFGISPLEAMQAAVPVVISKQSGVAEVLHYVIKIDFWDTNAMSDAIYGLLHYPVLSEFISKNGFTEINNLKWEYVGAKLLEIYKMLNKH
ncbi:MAG: glycosyltransferase family 4 protein [Bacteroidales bacterium]|jgi:glycosyltransferase involved in cell wall biosynthesis|nr:glycosyltransferase family 4 protein [Bacteroidales bacterium]